MIEVRDLCFAYSRKGEDVLKGITFDIPKAEVFGFLGPSGAGKSTLQKILLGLLKNYRGEVKVLGKEVRGVGADYYNQIGVGFELPNLYEQLTIMENLKTFGGLYKEHVDYSELLQSVGLYEHRMKKVTELSKGMKMRLNFCRALVGNPDVLFLDEPTSGLDPNNTQIIQEKILAYKREGHTVILTTHNMSFAEKVCDRVAFVMDGVIKEIGEPSELRRQYGEARLEVVTDKGKMYFDLTNLNKNSDFQACLREEVMSIETKRPTLEEIFTTVTGRVLV